MLLNQAELPGRDVSLFMKPAVAKEERSDGSVILRSTVPLQKAARCVGEWLEHWAAYAPSRLFLSRSAKYHGALGNGLLW